MRYDGGEMGGIERGRGRVKLGCENKGRKRSIPDLR